MQPILVIPISRENGQMCTLNHPLKAYCDPAMKILLSITFVPTQVHAGKIYYPEAAAVRVLAPVPAHHSVRKMRPDDRHLTLTGFPRPTTRSQRCLLASVFSSHPQAWVWPACPCLSATIFKRVPLCLTDRLQGSFPPPRSRFHFL